MSDRPRLYPVSGELFVQDTPAAGALVILRPLEQADANTWPMGFPRATVADDGSFQFETYDEGDGAPAGKYVLLAEWRGNEDVGEETDDSVRQNRLDPIYNDPGLSPWTVDIAAKRNRLPRFEATYPPPPPVAKK
ncbi:hypothetical protein [Anatilimnocola aggregata]|uniref:hypothetical protein n=1 Tax=Anatilimnocola aggregata TaxID=2528021 RepID=UPI0011A70D6C|nr:hypothetical protein [Anatilimnocola aggregata]